MLGGPKNRSAEPSLPITCPSRSGAIFLQASTRPCHRGRPTVSEGFAVLAGQPRSRQMRSTTLGADQRRGHARHTCPSRRNSAVEISPGERGSTRLLVLEIAFGHRDRGGRPARRTPEPVLQQVERSRRPPFAGCRSDDLPRRCAGLPRSSPILDQVRAAGLPANGGIFHQRHHGCPPVAAEQRRAVDVPSTETFEFSSARK